MAEMKDYRVTKIFDLRSREMKFIGWRRKPDEMVAHYYVEHDTTGADSIVLCQRFYGWQNDLVFPGPGMFFCTDCKEKAEEHQAGIYEQMFPFGIS